MPPRATVSAVVLLEGASDVAAVRSAAEVAGIDLTGARLVDLHGVTNIRRGLREAGQAWPGAEVVGMCDSREARFVERALREQGYAVRDPSDLPSFGFTVCERDLEEELIRALGPQRCVEVVEGLGLGGKLATLRHQPSWADRPLAEQLHRFCGVASGRKELLAGALASALTPETLPEPLRFLLDRLAPEP
ncbi:hypothetical protein ACQP1U_07715 [Actinomycetota bacterium]